MEAVNEAIKRQDDAFNASKILEQQKKAAELAKIRRKLRYLLSGKRVQKVLQVEYP
jgi:hypothetical protein